MNRTSLLLAASIATVAVAAPLLSNSAGLAADAPPQLKVTSDFSNGSGVIEAIDQQKRLIRLSPTPHDDRGWVCWWYVKVSGIAPGETISLDVGGSGYATPERATFSTDHKTWRQTEPSERHDKRIVYRQKIDDAEAWFAWGPPFTPDDAAALVQSATKQSRFAKAFELCRTREDRPVPALRVEQPNERLKNADRFGIWVDARQHAWESGGSWVCRGFTEWLVSDDADAESLRKKATIVIVPVMDIDNVAIGAGGKEQKPQDHNRDWSDKPYFPSVAAAQAEITKLDAQHPFDLFVDLHNPSFKDKAPHFFVPARELLFQPGSVNNLDHFLRVAQLEITGPLPYTGDTKTSDARYDKKWETISCNWVAKHTQPHVVAVCLETPWNTPHSTTDGYRQVGRQLGLTIERYLRISPRLGSEDKNKESK